jgi:AcrR family transcriptional regulator
MEMKTEADEERRPLRADALRNRERILTAASEVFAERGLDATLDEIALHAGVGVGTVYRRFTGKEELVEALFEQAVNELVDLAETAVAHEDSWDGLVWFLERATQMQASDRGLRDVVLHSGYGRERVAHARACIVPVVTRLVERAQADGYLRPDLVPADVPLLELMVSTVATYTSDLAPELWRRYLAIVIDGLATQRVNRTDLKSAPSREVVEAAMKGHKSRRS